MNSLIHWVALVLASGTGALFVGLGWHHRLPLLARGGWLLLSLTLFEASLTNGEAPVSYLLSALGGLVFLGGAPGFFHGVLNLPLPRALERGYGAWFGAYAALALVGLDPTHSEFVVPVLATLYFGQVLGGLGLAVYRWRHPGTLPALSRRFLLRLVLVAGVGLPFVMVDMITSLAGWSWLAPVNNLALPVFLGVLSVTLVVELHGWATARPNPEPVESSEPDKPAGDDRGLSPRERQIADRVWEGASAKEIAVELGLSPKTVENHTYRVYQKLGVRSRLQFFRRYR